ncbi:MAG: peptidoglycan editing factor PgeF [Halothiobacillaceae bacterium]|nr:peptidoglycan editing factor PgeF [Halothiobacillaceae bacterium]
MSFIIPDWPRPPDVRAVQTTRNGGVSGAPYASLNLATHVGDDPAHVQANRQKLRTVLALPSEPRWLEQVHGIEVHLASHENTPPHAPRADAAYTDQAGIVLAIMTADCLPVLLASRDGQEIAAAHAGWRGLLGGVLEASLSHFRAPPTEIIAWLGPAISQAAFEVGDEVRTAFMQHDPAAHSAFVPSPRSEHRAGHWQADLYSLARQRLAASGLQNVYGGELCSYSDSVNFYSYRREATTGRMASLIWRA